MKKKQKLYLYLPYFILVVICLSSLLGTRQAVQQLEPALECLYQDTVFSDITISSDQSFTESEIAVLDSLSEVMSYELIHECVLPVVKNEDKLTVAVFSEHESLSKFKVLKGRMPERAGECMIDSLLASVFHCNIGDIIRRDTDYVFGEGVLNTDELCVVGICESPEYLTKNRERYTTDHSFSTCFLVVCSDTFLQTENTVLLQLKSTQELSTFSSEYAEQIGLFEQNKDRVFQPLREAFFEAETKNGTTRMELLQQELDTLLSEQTENEQERETKLYELYNAWEQNRTKVQEEKDNLVIRREGLYEVGYSQLDADLVLQPLVDNLEKLEQQVKECRREYTDAVVYYQTETNNLVQEVEKSRESLEKLSQEFDLVTYPTYSMHSRLQIASVPAYQEAMIQAEVTGVKAQKLLLWVFAVVSGILLGYPVVSDYLDKKTYSSNNSVKKKLMERLAISFSMLLSGIAIGCLVSKSILERVIFYWFLPEYQSLPFPKSSFSFTKDTLLVVANFSAVSIIPGIVMFILVAVLTSRRNKCAA